jgi:hypothetical protein
MVLVPAILVLLAMLSGGIAAIRNEFPHVRLTQSRLASLVDKAAQRSPTFAALLQQLQKTDVVVFVQATTTLAGHITGRTFLVKATPLVRYVRSEVREDASENDIIVSIAHELQHAVEIATSDVQNDRAVERLYDSIGHRHSAGYETTAAQQVGSQVRQELARRPPDLRAAVPATPPPAFGAAHCAIS